MTLTSKLKCDLCGGVDLELVFSESNRSGEYSSYFCKSCDLHQTLGTVAPVSPDYIDLEESDLEEGHVFLQRRHKFTAFQQWQRVLAANGIENVSGLKLLDIGCGVGGFLEYAKEQGADCYGFDASRAQIEQAAKTFGNVRVAESLDDYSAQLGGTHQFDLITMWDVFEHIRNPDELLEEIRKHLSPNGLLYISVPSGAVNRAKVRLARWRGRDEIGLIPWEHVFYYTKKSLRTRLQNAGLQVRDVNGVVPYQRKVLNSHEIIRQMAHYTLRNTPYAFQIFGLASRSK